MAMNWLRGLVAPPAFEQAPGFGNPAAPQGGPPIGGMPQGGPPMGGMPQGGPPMGGMPQGASPYGVQPAFGGQPQPAPGPAPIPAYAGPSVGSAMEWSTGTRTQGQAAAGGTNAPALEARIVELERDVAHLALFARTLLTVLEESGGVTRERFEETKKRLDLLDGKLDDR